MRFLQCFRVGIVRLPITLVALVGVIVASGAFQAQVALAAGPFIGAFHTVTQISSTVPTVNGDVNPYGLFVAPNTIGNLVKGDALVSNFNNDVNLPAGEQGRGSTIVEIPPTPSTNPPLLFAQIDPKKLHGPCPGGVGLTTALVVLKRGWVIVGSLPTSDGTSATMKAGCLIVLNSQGEVVETFADDHINGPWDMTVRDNGSSAVLFVTNVLNGNVAKMPFDVAVNQGTVVRIPLEVPNQGDGIPTRGPATVIGSGFSEESDAAALVIGPTGVGLGKDGTLYVNDTVNNRISAIPDALQRDTTAFTGEDVTANLSLNGPLGLTIAPNGDILTVNSGDGNIVETTPDGAQVAKFTLDSTGSPPGAGTLFGVAVVPDGSGVYFVDDGSNTLNLFH
jgi:hypothetical protein